MMSYIYGFRPDSSAPGDGLDQAKLLLEELLHRAFVGHDSAYFGEYYRAAGPPESINIKSNEPDPEGDVLYPEFADWPVVIEIERSQRWDDLRQLMAVQALVHLRSEAR